MHEESLPSFLTFLLVRTPRTSFLYRAGCAWPCSTLCAGPPFADTPKMFFLNWARFDRAALALPGCFLFFRVVVQTAVT